jgi:hypothetical protein
VKGARSHRAISIAWRCKLCGGWHLGHIPYRLQARLDQIFARIKQQQPESRSAARD